MNILYSFLFIFVGGLLGYVSGMSFGVFGTLRSIICFVIALGTLSYLHTIPIAQKNVQDTILFTPQKEPKVIGICIILVMSTYLLWFTNNQHLDDLQLFFAYTEIVLLGVLPCLWIIICMIRDRNDFISIDQNQLIVSNAGFFSKEYTKIDLEDILETERKSTEILIHTKNREPFVIYGDQMNLFENEIVEVETFLKLHLKDRTKNA